MPSESATFPQSRPFWFAVIVLMFAVTCLPAFVDSGEPKSAPNGQPSDAAQWSNLITPEVLTARLNAPNTLVIDVRSEQEYVLGDIPGAINIPGDRWRTPPPRTPRPRAQVNESFEMSAANSTSCAMKNCSVRRE